ncbi:hypothetical protein AOLI_G00313140 [Acnodon oligacanthus]
MTQCVILLEIKIINCHWGNTCNAERGGGRKCGGSPAIQPAFFPSRFPLCSFVDLLGSLQSHRPIRHMLKPCNCILITAI